MLQSRVVDKETQPLHTGLGLKVTQLDASAIAGT
jgi:hypothetical protein